MVGLPMTTWMNECTSVLGVGTVELGARYGLYRPGEADVPSGDEAVALLHAAFDQGVSWVDTAPAYGEAQRVLGRALRAWPGRVLVASKVDNNPRVDLGDLGRRVRRQVEDSLRDLGVERIDLVQVHNATARDVAEGVFFDTLERLRREGKVGHIGATVYEEADALAVMELPQVSVVQVPYSVLDRRMERRVFPLARKWGVDLVLRSVLLKGVLAGRQELLPPHLGPLAEAGGRFAAWAQSRGLDPAAVAIAYALRSGWPVVVGVRNQWELATAIDAATLWLDAADQGALDAMAQEASWVDPRTWNVA